MIARDTMPYRPSTLAYINDGQGNFLLVEKESYQDNQWAFPGGGIDQGETAEEAVKQELQEELGSNKFVILGKSNQTFHYEFPDETIQKNFEKKGVWQRGQEITSFWVRFTGDKNELSPKDAIRKIKWVTRSELKNHLVFPNQWQTTEKIIEELADQ